MKKILFGAFALLAVSSTAFAGGEDIYPGGFVEDCSYSSLKADPMYKIWKATGNQVDDVSATKAYKNKCECLSDKFFSESHSDTAWSYEVYMLMLEYRDVRGVPMQTKNRVQRNINACQNEGMKRDASDGVKRFDSAKKSSGDPLKDSFMSDLRSSLQRSNQLNEPSLRKADYITTCLSKEVTEYKSQHPDTADYVTKRWHENLKAGEYVKKDVYTNEPLRQAELKIIAMYNCW